MVFKKFYNITKNFSLLLAKYQTLTISTKYILEAIAFCIIIFLSINSNQSNNPDGNSLTLLATFTFAAYKSQPLLMNVFNAINSVRYGNEITQNIKERFDKQNSNYLDKKKEIWKPNNKLTNFISLSNISYNFKNNFDRGFELNIKNLELKSKGILVISGKSGAGKSTLLNIIARLYKPDSGIIFLMIKL